MNITDNDTTQLQRNIDEATQLQGNRDESTQLHDSNNNEAPQLPDTKEDKGGKNKLKTTKKVVGFAGAGVLLGSTSTLFPEMKGVSAIDLSQEEGTEDRDEGYLLPEVDTQETAELTDNIINDGMTFEEAFSTAREALGAGSAFEWRGTVYGTYTKEEWVEMTDEEKSDFYDSLNLENPFGSAEEADEVFVEVSDPEGYVEVEEVNVSNQSETDESVTQEVENSTTMEEGDQDYAQEIELEDTDNEDTDGIEIISVDGAEEEEVQILGLEDDLEEGANPDGEDVYVIDIDGDMTYDAIWVDNNHDGIIDEDEIIDIQDVGLTVSDLNEMQDMTGDMYGNEEAPDYFLDMLNDDIV